MSFKTIFTALSSFDTSKAALVQAARLTEAQDAHLEVMCLGIDRSRSNYYEVGANAVIMQAAIEEAHAQAESTREQVIDWLGKSTIRWNATNSVATFTDMNMPLSKAARFADLCVASLPYRSNSRAEENVILETMMFDAGCPTVVTPDVDPVGRPERIVIGWNESAEALRAVRAAVPLMQSAKEVHIAIIDPPEHAPDRSDPGGALAVMLARHGISCDIQVMTRSGAKVSERLRRHATETGAQMLVMGAYGHSRFREAVLGGATREMLEHAQTPVFMAH
ncbi:universal stress protein [uncultured Roseobacter sp.]|uniref:universal stress protein n=1 Tax=uncultured Roseobacter sp. TaxID=114847 RepID=UPI00262E331B|nr:universal stress protein [uncultured Roseobacter sp.]